MDAGVLSEATFPPFHDQGREDTSVVGLETAEGGGTFKFRIFVILHTKSYYGVLKVTSPDKAAPD